MIQYIITHFKHNRKEVFCGFYNRGYSRRFL